MKNKFLRYLIGLVPLLWSLPGFAATTFDPKPSSDDMVLSILAKTVGPSINKISGVGNGTLSDITKLLMDINSLVLILGGLLLTYVIGASIMKTAHEGEAMGQKWSSMWIPMKAAIGAALILPVPSLGGLSAAQGIVIWMLTFGIGAADAAWDQVIHYIAKDPVGSVVVSPVSTGQMAAGIVDSQVCAMAINETVSNYYPLAQGPIVTRSGPTVMHTLNPIMAGVHVIEGYDTPHTPIPGGSAYLMARSEYQWTADSSGILGDLSSMDILPTACGKTTFVSGVDGTAHGYGGDLINTVGGENATAIGTLISSLHPISSNLFAEKKTGKDDSNFIKAINAYDTTMQTDIVNAANTAVKAQVQKYESAAKTDGFATAGEWFWDLVQWNRVAQQSANNLGDATGMNLGSFLGKMGSSHVKNADARVQSFIHENGSLVGHVKPTSNASSDIANIFGEATPLLVNAISSSNPDPLIAIRNLGVGLETAGGAIYVGTAAATALAGAATGGIDKIIPGEGNMVNAIAKVTEYDVVPFGLFIAGALLVEGFFLSFVVPLIPFMVWVSALLGFLFMAFEMIVAAPLWGIMHMHPEGHEVVGMGSQGYKMALAIVTRPFLMIVGFIGGYALFMGFTELVTPMISKAVVSSQGAGGGFTGPFDMIGAVGIYATLMIIIAYECFKLTFVLPERVMNWASARIEGYNEGGTLDSQKKAHEGAKGQATTTASKAHEIRRRR